MDGSVVEESRGITGVRDVVGERIRDWHHAGGPIALDAFDPRYFTSDEFGRWKLIGRHLPDVWGMVARGEGVLASTSFVQNLRVDVGSRITLDTPGGPLPLIVAGMTSAFAAPRGTIEISRALYERYWSDDQVTRVHLRLSPGSDVQAVRHAIARQFGGRYRLRILSAGELLDYWTREVRQAFAGLHAVAGLVLLIVLLGMADTLAAGVVERRRELGTVRAVGGRRRTVHAIVLGEGALLGAIGLMLAGAAGIALGRLWVDLTLPCLLGWALDFHMPLATVAGIGIVSVLVCLCAGLVPAARAAGVPPAVALRYE
jgi:putative ABC transport system permease protein